MQCHPRGEPHAIIYPAGAGLSKDCGTEVQLRLWMPPLCRITHLILFAEVCALQMNECDSWKMRVNIIIWYKRLIVFYQWKRWQCYGHMLVNNLLFDRNKEKNTRSHLKIRVLVQGQGGSEFPRRAGLPAWSILLCGLQPTGILMYVEDLIRLTNAETCTPLEDLSASGRIGPKDYFEIASNEIQWKYQFGGI